MSQMLNRLERVRHENLASSYSHPSYILECSLADAMAECNREKCLELLETINSLERATLSESPLQSLQNSLICSCTCYARTAIRSGVDVETAFNLSDLYIREVSKTNSVNRLVSVESDMMLDFISLIERRKENIQSENPAVDKILKYIQNNITHHLSLSQIAEHVKMHPAYVSTLFHQETGMPLSAYINNYRIESIKRFLRETDLKMVELSEIFSFSSAAHFSSYFKKHTGISPKTYRSSY